MLKKLKNSQILDLVEGISRINNMDLGDDVSKKFNYALILNDNNNRPIAKAVIEVSNPSETYAEYEKKREELILDYCIIDDDGNPVLTDDKWIKLNPDTRDEFNDKLEILNNEYKDVLAQREKDLQDFNSILNTEVEVDIITVPIDDVPDIVGKDMTLMRLIINMIE